MAVILSRLQKHFKQVWWHEGTGQLEEYISLLLFMRGVWMLIPWWQSIPLEVQGYLIPADIPETTWGIILITLAIGQFITSLLRAAAMRGMIATFAAVIQGIAAIAYWNGGLFFRSAVPFIIGITLGEMIVAWRAWHDPAVARTLLERRSDESG